MIISAPRYPSKVTVYEPSQVAGQAEVVLDEFEMAGGEEKDYQLPSATAAYRFERLEAHAVRRLRDLDEMEKHYNDPPGANQPPPQEPVEGLSPDASAELDVGKKRGAENAKREEAIQKRRQEADKRFEERRAETKRPQTREAIGDDAKDAKLEGKRGTQDYVEGGDKGKQRSDAGTPAVDAADRSQPNTVASKSADSRADASSSKDGSKSSKK
jgi:hypothetical protein